MPYRSNIPKTSDLTFAPLGDSDPKRARQGATERVGHAIVGGLKDGPESSRENAPPAPRDPGLGRVRATSFARIPWQNLVDFGVLPPTFADPSDDDRLEIGDQPESAGVAATLAAGRAPTASPRGKDEIRLTRGLSPRQVEGRLGKDEDARTVA